MATNNSEKTETDEKAITVRLSLNQHEWVMAECDRLHESQSTIIRGLIREKMEAEKQAEVITQ